MSWKRLSRKTVYQNRWMNVFEDVVKTESGHELTYGVVEKNPCALIIPWDGKCFTLIGQYRYPIDDFSWEFPQGHGEHSSLRETAQKELQEETGLHAEKIDDIGCLTIAAGFCTQTCQVYFASQITPGSTHREEGEEGMQVRAVSPEQLHSMITSGEIRDSHTIAAYTLLQTKGIL